MTRPSLHLLLPAAKAIETELIALRRQLHQNPELSDSRQNACLRP
ncbi:hypothetical protein [Paenibacillus sp. LPE1-1-1.1]